MCISDVDDLDMLYALFYVIFVSLKKILLYRTPVANADVKIPFGPKSVQNAARARASLSTPGKSNTPDRKRPITSPTPAVYVYVNC